MLNFLYLPAANDFALLALQAATGTSGGSSGGLDPTTALTIYGPLGVFASISVFFFRNVYMQAVKRANALEDELRTLNETFRKDMKDIFPVLQATEHALARASDLLIEYAAEMRVMRELGPARKPPGRRPAP